ncbi:MAG: flagellar biosynthetic protein FliR [Eubacteriales bacterium]
MEAIINPYSQLDVFLLIFIRMVSFISVAPLFGIKNVPVFAKIGLAFFLALIMFNITPIEGLVNNNTIFDYTYLIIKEIFVGWVIGFGAYLTFTIITLAGQLIDYQIGFTMVNVLDPLSQIQLSITGNLYYYLLLLIMLSTNMHFFLIDGLIQSFTLVPIGKVVANVSLYHTITDFFAEYFIIAFKISTPIFAGILIVNVILGILARTVPQMNMFIIGLPLKVYVGLMILFITIRLMPSIADFIFNKMLDLIDELLTGLKP